MIRSAAAGALAALLCWPGCAADPGALYPKTAFAALRDRDPGSMAAHRNVLVELVDQVERSGGVPAAGLCAELGYYAWRLGDRAAARAAFDQEARHHPEARRFVEQLRRHLEAGGSGEEKDTGPAPARR